jgi:hypothetical protein
MEKSERNERVRDYLKNVVQRKKFEDEGELSGSEYMVLLYLGSRGCVSDLDKLSIDKNGMKQTSGLEGATHVQISRDLDMLPAQITRVTSGLGRKECAFQLSKYNCVRIGDARVREEILSRKGTELYDNIVDLMLEF